MTTTIETLNKDGNTILPVTIADAVTDSDGHTVQQRIDDGVFLKDGGSSSALVPWITNDMILDGTITNNKLNKKSATTVTHAGWAADKDKIPDMSFMAFWNGAYDGSNASNLQYFKNGSVKTNTLADKAVTSDKLADDILYWKSGDVYSMTGLNIGMNCYDATHAQFTIQTPKRTDKISSISVSGNTGNNTFGWQMNNFGIGQIRISNFVSAEKNNQYSVTVRATIDKTLATYAMILMHFGAITLTFN